MDCSLSGSSVHGIFQARVPEWTMSFSRDLPDPGIEPGSPALQAGALPSELPGKPRNTQKNYTKKDLHDPDNHDAVITHLEPDILEREVKWALESNTMNKASGGDGIPVELFQILKDNAVKVLHSICQQIWKTQQWPQDSKKCFHSNPKERQCQRMLKLPHNCTHLTC